MKSFLKDPLEFLYPDTLRAVAGEQSYRTQVARGGIASVNLVLLDLSKDGLVFQLDGVPRPLHSELFLAHAVTVNQNSGPVGFCEQPGAVNPYKTRQAPFRVFDALEKVDSGFSLGDAADAVFLLQIPIPRTAKPGTHRLRITVYNGPEEHQLEFTFRIAQAVLPKVGRDSFCCTNWFSVDHMADRHGLKPWSPAHYRMIGDYARLMARSRQNTFWLPQRWYIESVDGELVFNAARFRKLVKIFTDAGLYYIEGGHFATRPGKEWGAPKFELVLTHHLVDSMEANRELAEIAAFLNRELTRGKLAGRYFQHAADEPILGNAESFRILCGLIRKYLPGVPLLDAMSDPEIAGAVDIWCPQIQHYENRRADFDATRLQGDRVWCYTCCFPGGNYPNRLLDFELVRIPVLFWGCAVYGLEGFLHWGLNQYQADQSDPLEVTAAGHGNGCSLPPGDTHVVYPGPHGPWGSLRLEAQRAGLEDLELLRQLKKRSPACFARLAATVFRSFTDYTKEAAVLAAAREKVLEALDHAEA